MNIQLILGLLALLVVVVVMWVFERTRSRLAPFFDPSAWVLLLASCVPLALIDLPMLLTLGQWTAYGLALAGVSVVLCRLLLPQIDLSDFVKLARNGSTAAAILASAVIGLLAVLFLGLVLWARA